MVQMNWGAMPSSVPCAGGCPGQRASCDHLNVARTSNWSQRRVRCGALGRSELEEVEGGADDGGHVEPVQGVGVLQVGGLPELGDAEAGDRVSPYAGEERQRVGVAVDDRDQR